MSMSLKIVGTMGLQANPTDKRHIAITATNTRGAACILDFSDCHIPEINILTSFIYVDSDVNIYIYELSVGGGPGGSGSSKYCLIQLNKGTCFLDKSIVYVKAGFAIGSSQYGSGSIFLSNSIFRGSASWGGNSVVRGNHCSCLGSITPNNFASVYFCNSNISTVSAGDSSGTSMSWYVNCNFYETSNSIVQCYWGNNFISFINCNIKSNSSNPAVAVWADFSGKIVINSCKIICASTAIKVDSANTNTEIILANSFIKGISTQDIQQTTAAGTIKWYIMGNNFSRASIIVDGTIAISYKTASAVIYFPQYANKFSRIIE